MLLSAIVILSDQRLPLGVCGFSCGFVGFIFFFYYSCFLVLHTVSSSEMDKNRYFWGVVLTTTWIKSYTFNVFFRLVRSHLLGIDSVIWAQPSYFIAWYIEHMALSWLVTPCAKKSQFFQSDICWQINPGTRVIEQERSHSTRKRSLRLAS